MCPPPVLSRLSLLFASFEVCREDSYAVPSELYLPPLAAVADILLKYDSDQKVPVYGFGAKRHPNESVSHCFPLVPGHDNSGEVNGTL